MYILSTEESMQKVPIKIKKLDKTVPTPKYAKEGDACFDLATPMFFSLKPGEYGLIRLGIAMEIPFGYEVQLRPRSGLSLKTGLMAKNTIGTIDSGYRGELGFVAINMGKELIEFQPGDRVCQACVKPVYVAEFEVVDELSDSERGEGGFGSTKL